MANGYSQTSEEFYKKGNSKWDLKDYQGAILDYTKAISIEPDRLRVKEPAILSNILEEKKTKINEDARAKKTTTKTPCSKSTQTQYFCLLF